MIQQKKGHIILTVALYFHPELPLHQVCPSDHLRDGMFHLQPRVHLHEVEVMLGVHDKLHSACREPTRRQASV